MNRGRDPEIRTTDSEVAALLGADTEAGRPADIA
jgi:hypothetical protein